MRRVTFFWAIFLFFMLGESQFVKAQWLRPKGPFLLNLDYARFRYDQKSGYLEVYCGFHPKDLVYDWSESDSAFIGGLRLWIRIKNPATGEFLVNERSSHRIVVEDTASVAYKRYFVIQRGFVLPQGDFRLWVLAVDSLSSMRRDSLQLPLTIPSFTDGPKASDLEFCSSIRPSANLESRFYKNSLEVVPNPTLIFGIMTDPVLFYYMELYSITPGERYTVRTRLFDRTGRKVKEIRQQRTYRSRDAIEAGMMNVSSVPSGTYLCRVDLLDKQDQLILQKEKKFYILNPHIKASQSVREQLLAALSSLSSDSLDREFEQASYLATNREISLYRQLTTLEGKRQFLADFWSKVAEGKSYFPPIQREAYMQRVRIANLKYGLFGKEGWQTDRGRVFIIYGKPDEIERFPSTMESKPYEIWRYFNIENGVEFIFVDRAGTGEYELVHSTKRGELQDENWQRFIY